METTRRWHWWCTVAMGLALATQTGCQTWTWDSGMTLPSGHYLQHPPQYIPPDPAFPLTRELAHMEAGGAPVPGLPPEPVPAPLPVPGAPPPPP
jgi:hypothetical protein